MNATGVGPAQLTGFDINCSCDLVIYALKQRFSLSISAISEAADQLATLGRMNR